MIIKFKFNNSMINFKFDINTQKTYMQISTIKGSTINLNS